MRRLAFLSTFLLSACPTPPPLTDAGTDAGPIACPELALNPPRIDLGCVQRGDAVSWPLDAGATALPPDGGALTLDDASVLHFTPDRAGEFSVQLPLFRGECPIGTQQVIATGVDSMLTWWPPVVDLGWVEPGFTARGEVTFSSCSYQPIDLVGLETREGTSASSVFGVDAGAHLVPAAFRTDAGALVRGELVVPLTFSPTVLGPRQGQLAASTALPLQSAVSVTLRGVGGGPRIDVQPTTVDFGAVVVPTSRQVTVTNIGHPGVNLFFGLGRALPYFSLMPGDCATVTMGSYDPLVGIAPNGSVAFTIEVTPSAMPRTCTLEIDSTDPATPVVTVTITTT